MDNDSTPREVGALSEGLGLAPERATCERCDFMLAATREAQAFAAHYSDEVLELRATVETLRTALLDANQICRSVPRSCKVVPRYPTDAMLRAASQGTTHAELRRVWDAMLAAAPQAESEGPNVRANRPVEAEGRNGSELSE